MQDRACLLEKVIRKAGFICVHDGSNSPRDFVLPPEEVACFTRKYRLVLDGAPVNTWITFKYDSRSGYADMEIHSKDPDTKGREKLLLGDDAVREVQA